MIYLIISQYLFIGWLYYKAYWPIKTKKDDNIKAFIKVLPADFKLKLTPAPEPIKEDIRRGLDKRRSSYNTPL